MAHAVMAQLLRLFNERRNAVEAVEQAVMRMQVQMAEAAGHAWRPIGSERADNASDAVVIPLHRQRRKVEQRPAGGLRLVRLTSGDSVMHISYAFGVTLMPLPTSHRQLQRSTCSRSARSFTDSTPVASHSAKPALSIFHVSGGEYNVAANLSDCFGLKTGIATAMVNSPIGDLVQGRVREMGVMPFYKHFEHDGVRGPNIATVYSDRGHGVRAPVVFYNRANEAAALLKVGDFDWKALMSGGVRWFHSGGIFAALSETTAALIIDGMKAAKAQGAVISFDLNYRGKLWKSVGGDARAVAVLRKIVANVDCLIGNEEDLQKGLGVKGPEVTKKEESKLNPDVFFGMIENTVKEFPNVKLVATTLRRNALGEPARLGRGCCGLDGNALR